MLKHKRRYQPLDRLARKASQRRTSYYEQERLARETLAICRREARVLCRLGRLPPSEEEPLAVDAAAGLLTRSLYRYDIRKASWQRLCCIVVSRGAANRRREAFALWRAKNRLCVARDALLERAGELSREDLRG